MPQLVTVSGSRIPLQRGHRYVVGRGRDADIVLDDRSCSRRHVRLVVAGARDELFLEDLGSHNGTFVDGALVRGRTLLREGSRIQLGAAVLLVRRDDSDAEPETGTMTFRQSDRDQDAGELSATEGVLSILRRLHAESRSGTLFVALPDATAAIEVRGGEVLFAEFAGLEGFNALVRTARQSTGIYWLTETGDEAPCERNVTERTERLLDEIARCVDPTAVR